jgi:23S rRNA (uracil1939-C5)-methyltransferase
MKPFSSNSPESMLASITDAMTDRVEPRCRHFGTCGGCQLQHLP